jgi:hypothetical protein
MGPPSLHHTSRLSWVTQEQNRARMHDLTLISLSCDGLCVCVCACVVECHRPKVARAPNASFLTRRESLAPWHAMRTPHHADIFTPFVPRWAHHCCPLCLYSSVGRIENRTTATLACKRFACIHTLAWYSLPTLDLIAHASFGRQ